VTQTLNLNISGKDFITCSIPSQYTKGKSHFCTIPLLSYSTCATCSPHRSVITFLEDPVICSPEISTQTFSNGKILKMKSLVPTAEISAAMVSLSALQVVLVTFCFLPRTETCPHVHIHVAFSRLFRRLPRGL